MAASSEKQGPPDPFAAVAGMDRRRFLACAAAAASVPWAVRAFAAEVPKKPHAGAPKEDDVQLPEGGTVPKRTLGRTGEKVSVLGLGGFHIGLPKTDQAAIRIIRTAIDHGVTFMDNCWDYNEGKSHRRMGMALLDGYRQRVFLMTKIDGRTRKSAEAQIDQSLRDLKTDVIDLMQIHEVIRMDDPKRVFGDDGAIQALLAAKKAGKIRFIGFTGHKSADIHLEMLKTAAAQEFKFDAVQMPLNVIDGNTRGFQSKVLPVLLEQDIAVLGMKPLGSGMLLRSQPLATRQLTPTDCLQYVMNLPTSVVITGCDTVGVLKQGINAAMRFRPQADAWMTSILGKTAPLDEEAWEKYKHSDTFDGTAQHPWWLDTASLKKT